jgi:hypothetical protein
MVLSKFTYEAYDFIEEETVVKDFYSFGTKL